MTKVSIIVPIYNVEKYLEECLTSIVNQTLKDIEIICINDGSTDNSLQILEKFANTDKRIKVINKENSGYGATMNIGLKNAHGEYIGIVESDDFVENNMFENLYKLAQKDDLDFVKSDFYLYNSKTNMRLKRCIIKKHPINKTISLDDDITILSINPSIWSAIYKREFLKSNNIKFLETAGASYQDASFQCKVFMTSKRFLLTDEAYLYYRQDNENSSMKNIAKVYCVMDEYKEVHNYINNHSYLKKYESYICVVEFNAYRWNLSRISVEFKKEFFEKFYYQFDLYKKQGFLDKTFMSYRPKNFKKFMNKPQNYLQTFINKENNKKWKQLINSIVQIRIKRSDISIVLFGKELIRK